MASVNTARQEPGPVEGSVVKKVFMNAQVGLLLEQALRLRTPYSFLLLFLMKWVTEKPVRGYEPGCQLHQLN